MTREYGKLMLTEQVEGVEKTEWGERPIVEHRPVAEPRKGLWWTAVVEPHVAIRLKRTFARIGKQFGAIHLLDSDEVCRDLLWFIERFPVEMIDSHREYLESQAAKYDARMGTFHRLLSGDLEPHRFELALPPRDYQRVAADLLIRAGGLLIADDLGIGKTVTAIAALTDPRTRPALVVTLTHLPNQWRRELQKFAPQLTTHVLEKGTPYDIVELLSKRRFGRRPKKPKKGDQLDLVPPTVPFPDVLICNYHKLAGWADVLAGKVKTVIYDECQELRRRGSNKYHGAKHISDNAIFRGGLSATPFYNYGGEMFNVMECIQKGSLGTWTEFIEEWCDKSFSTQEDKAKVSDPKAFGTYLRENGLMIRRTRADVARELPDLIRITQDIPYDAKPLDAMKGSVAELAKILLGKADFTTKGQAARELDWKLRQATGLAKAPHVADFVKLLIEQGEKVVLYGWHREVYSIWMERLVQHRPVMYTGSESAKQKESAIRQFTEGESEVLLISLRAGAGLDGLQGHTRTVVFGELDWSPGIHEQCEGRVHRDGQKEAVAAYYMIADGGSDPIVADVLGVKDQQVRGVRDPKGDSLNAQTDEDRLKKLARAYLESQGVDISSLDEP